MGFFDSLFDGKQKTISTLDPQQQRLQKALGSRLTALMGGPAQYSGQLTAPISQGEQSVVDQFSGLQQPGFARLQSLINPDPNAFETNFRQEIVEPAYRNYREYVQPLIEESLPSFSTARGDAVKAGALDVADQVGQLRFLGREAERDRSLRALNEAGQFGTTALGIAGTPRLIEQAGLDRQFQAFVQGNPQMSQAINAALGFLNVDTQAIQQSSSPFERIAGVVGLGTSIAGAMQGNALSRVIQDYYKSQAPQTGGV